MKCVCVYVCMCICVYVCMCVCVYMYVWGLCYSFFTRQTLASWRLVLACHLISTPTTRNSTRGATLHLMDCRSEGWSLAVSGSQSGCGLTDFVLIPRRRSFFGARLVDGALILTPGS